MLGPAAPPQPAALSMLTQRHVAADVRTAAQPGGPRERQRAENSNRFPEQIPSDARFVNVTASSITPGLDLHTFHKQFHKQKRSDGGREGAAHQSGERMPSCNKSDSGGFLARSTVPGRIAALRGIAGRRRALVLGSADTAGLLLDGLFQRRHVAGR